ncbi:MAG: FAD-dependent oxidoreductase [Candidatus Roizmanbacteria bacterium]
MPLFKELFPEVFALYEIDHLRDSYSQRPINNVFDYRCYPWSFGNVSLIGDSAHSTTPFFGQGLNLALEDVRTLKNIILEEDNYNIKEAVKKWQLLRKVQADACMDLSQETQARMSTKQMRDKL